MSESFKFARFLAHASALQFYIVIGEMGDNSESKMSRGGWANSESVETMGAFFANCKVGELLELNHGKVLSKTPIPEFQKGHGSKGGICFQDYYVAVHGLSPEHNELVAAIILYQHLYQDIQLHHVGIACTEKDLAIHKNDLSGFQKNKSNLSRFYIPQDDSNFGKTYNEFFCDHQEPDVNEIHFDFVADNIEQFMNFIFEVTCIEPTYPSDPEENDPRANLYIIDQKGKFVGIMARHKFWEPEKD